MTERRPITRRDSLKGIATTGVLLGGATFGSSSVTAGEDKKKPDAWLEGVCHEGERKKDDEYHSLRAKFRIHNETDDELKFMWKEGHGKKKGWISSTSKGWIHVEPHGSDTFWVDLNGDHTKKVFLYHDGKKIDYARPNLKKECPDDECPECSFDTDAIGNGAANLLSVGPDASSGFPDIDARVRVDTPMGNDGDLDAGNFAICEDGCGQTIDTVAFEPGGLADIVVVFDDTGSMGGEIGALQDQVTSLTDDIEDAGVDARYALVSFKDDVEIDTDFTDASTFQTAVDALSASGGGDTPEDNVDALAVGTGNAPTEGGDSLSAFRSGAQRIVIDITDAPAHDETDDRTRFSQSEIETFLDDGNVTFYAVAPASVSSGVSKRDIAETVDDGTWIDIDGADFDVILNDIVDEITEPAYVLSYTTTNPATDGSDRTVDVEVDDPDEGLSYVTGTYTAPN